MIISERETDTHLYFLRGVLSNFEKCYIKYKGHLFATTEQAFMWEKAIFFNDHESASKILKEENKRLFHAFFLQFPHQTLL